MKIFNTQVKLELWENHAMFVFRMTTSANNGMDVCLLQVTPKSQGRKGIKNSTPTEHGSKK